MAEFTPITISTQEEMDNLFKDRVNRVEKKYSGYIAPEALDAVKADYEKRISDMSVQLESANSGNTKAAEEFNAKIAELEKAVSERDAKIGAHELRNSKVAAALDAGLPYEIADRLNGSTAEELKADAERLAAFVNSKNVQPLRNPEASAPEDGVVAAFRKMNPNLKF